MNLIHQKWTNALKFFTTNYALDSSRLNLWIFCYISSDSICLSVNFYVIQVVFWYEDPGTSTCNRHWTQLYYFNFYTPMNSLIVIVWPNFIIWVFPLPINSVPWTKLDNLSVLSSHMNPAHWPKSISLARFLPPQT